MPRPSTIESFVSALEARDARAITDLLSEDAVLVSPITDAFRFHGRAAVGQVFGSAFDLFTGTTCHTVTGEGDTWAVFLRGTISGQQFEECQLLRLDDQGLVREVTMIGRPVATTLTVMARIGGAMYARGLMSRGAALAGAGVRPVAAVLGLVERHLLPKLPPRRDVAAP